MRDLTRKIPIALLAAVMALAFVSFADYNGGFAEPAFAEDGVEYEFNEESLCMMPNHSSSVGSHIWAHTGDDYIYVPATNVEVIQQNPQEPGTDVVRVYYDNDEEEYWCDALNPGEAQLKISYTRLDGQTDFYIKNFYCIDTSYNIITRTANKKSKGFPGDEFTIIIEAEKYQAWQTPDGQWQTSTTTEGLSTETTLGNGSEYATLDTSGDNPVVRFNDLPEGKDSISENVEVITKLIDKNATGTLHGYTEHTLNLNVCDAYDQIEPTKLSNPDLGIGETETFQPKVRHYSLANPEGTDVDNVKFYWDYPEDTSSILKCEDGVCSITRVDYWAQSHRLMAEVDYGDWGDTLYVDYELNEVEECTHENLITKAAVKATLTKKGNTRYYICKDCGRYFRDANAEDEIAANSWVIPARVMTVKAAKSLFTVKATKVKKAAQTIKAPIKVTFKKTSMKTKLTYKLSSVSKAKFKKYFTVNKTTGKLTIKKGLKKGTYTVKVKVTAAANAKYAAATKTATLKVKVK